MKIVSDFVVLTSLNEDEEKPKDSCVIVVDTKDVTDFVRYLDEHTMLSVYSVRKMEHFFFTIDSFYQCCVIEVSLKEDVGNAGRMTTCEQVAIAETYSFLHRQSYEKK